MWKSRRTRLRRRSFRRTFTASCTAHPLHRAATTRSPGVRVSAMALQSICGIGRDHELVRGSQTVGRGPRSPAARLCLFGAVRRGRLQPGRCGHRHGEPPGHRASRRANLRGRSPAPMPFELETDDQPRRSSARRGDRQRSLHLESVDMGSHGGVACAGLRGPIQHRRPVRREHGSRQHGSRPGHEDRTSDVPDPVQRRGALRVEPRGPPSRHCEQPVPVPHRHHRCLDRRDAEGMAAGSACQRSRFLT